MMVFAGDVEAGERAVAPFQALTRPAADLVRPMPYPEIYQLTEGGPGPAEEAARSMFVNAVDLRTAEAIVDHLQASTAPLAVAQLRVLGGAMARVPAEATAFAHRQKRVMAAIGAVYERLEAGAVHEAWVSAFAAALRQGDGDASAGGVYVNFLGDEGARSTTPITWDRLAAVGAPADQPVRLAEYPTGHGVTSGRPAVLARPLPDKGRAAAPCRLSGVTWCHGFMARSRSEAQSSEHGAALLSGLAVRPTVLVGMERPARQR
jgi:hypothetical protein